MRKIYQLAWLLIGTSLFAQTQNPEIKTELPTIMAPSPTVAALMKFEEVPVSNYTGVPDISIPLFSTSTHSKDINLNISLKYHPSAVNADEISSDAGLGWSLFAGGTISRTVRGLPDEYLKAGVPKMGLYHTQHPSDPNRKNKYYAFNNYIHNGIAMPQYDISEFLWETNEKKTYDSEHDFWQFEFMGYSGRFYIKKNTSTGFLEVVKLDADNSLKIVNTYDTSASITKYSPISFTIFDDKGYKYIFDISEETAVSSSTVLTYLDASSGISITEDLRPYISAFHLSKVYDTNEKLLIEFKYSPYSKEVVVDETTTHSYMLSVNESEILQTLQNSGCSAEAYEPKTSLQRQYRDTKVRKLSEIWVDGLAKISFLYSQGRSDTNMLFAQNAFIFKGIEVKNWQGLQVKKVSLAHSYLSGMDTRLSLSKVSFENFENTIKEDYELFYRDNTASSKDAWGYLSNDGDSTGNLLQKMTKPTGGSIIYDFEPSQYSYIGSVPVINFDDNMENWEDAMSEAELSAVNTASDFFNITDAQSVSFDASVYKNPIYANEGLDWRFQIFKIEGGIEILSGEITHSQCGSDFCQQNIFLNPGQYKVRIKHSNLPYPPVFSAAHITAHYKLRPPAIRQSLPGGGNRIRRIGFFEEQSVPKNFYQGTYPTIQPKKEKNYRYNSLDEPLMSSGSLVYHKPVFSYNATRNLCLKCGNITGQPSQIYYNFVTDFNNLSVIRTQGGDVGYKHVAVFETGNGKSQYEYTSPIDFPNTDEKPPTPPFLPEPSNDFQRGLLLTEKIFDETNRILSEATYGDYEFDTYSENTGFRTVYINNGGCPATGGYRNYDAYISAVNTCSQCFCLCGDTSSFIGFIENIEAFGWVKSMKKSMKNYFYEGANQRVMESNQTFLYNAINKNLASHTVTNSNNDILKTDYFYHTGNSPTSQNRTGAIEKIENRNGTTILSVAKIEYANTSPGNASWLPQTIISSKETQASETRIRYSLYDEFSNPLEVQQEKGTKTCYIWGYNKTQPVAKIDNVAYSDIPISHIAAVQNASDAIPYIEQNLINALNALRTALDTAMVTTYTYKPLIGVSTITDPKGDKISYEYDAFGRLKSVRDKDGNLLSENEYYYRTQN